MDVYLVYHSVPYEFNDVIGVFSDYVKAREFELAFHKDNAMMTDETTAICKVEVDKKYSRWSDIGEEV